MEDEKRRMKDYVILESLQIGACEILLGEREEKGADDCPYICAYCEKNALFSRYTGIKGGTYLEMLALYAERIQEQIKIVSQELDQRAVKEPDLLPDRFKSIEGQHLGGQVVLIKKEILQPQYRRADYLMGYVIGGFGAYPEARGQAVFIKNLYDGKETVYERSDIAGILDPETLPSWAKANYFKFAEKYHRSEAEKMRPLAKPSQQETPGR